MTIVKLNVEDQNIELEVKEYKGNRVVSFRDVDNLHRRPIGTSRKTFNSHRKQFVENVDYFVLNTDEAQTMYGLRAPNGVILLTESGYLLLVKPFTDELAWKVQRQMVNAYFKAKEMIAQKQPEQPSTIEDILISALTSMKEMKLENAELKKTVQHLELVVDNEVWITEHQKSEIRDAVKKRIGYLMGQAVDAHFQGLYGDLNTFFGVSKYDKIKRVDFEQALEFVRGWYPKKKENSPS